MNFQEYKAYFESLLNKSPDEQHSPYDNPDYLDYTKLNWSRMNRWMKTAKLSEEMLKTISAIKEQMDWTVITEPWCGDASHSIPFIEMMAQANPLITVSYELRDSPPYLIDQYLTNGTKSIPKLIIKNASGNLCGTWGPRPENCQKIYSVLMAENVSFERVKVELQNWYNENKGEDIQKELLQILRSLQD